LRFALALIVSALALVILPAESEASPNVRYGVQDDGWLAAGPGALPDRLAELQRLGVDLYRFTLRWDQVAKRRPAAAGNPRDAAYDWSWPDSAIRGLRAHGIAPVVTIWGTPRWANGGRAPSYAPRSTSALAAFASAAATRYRAQATLWVIWNEPNQRRSLRPASALTYTRLLNASYVAIKRANPSARVAGGVTAPRGNAGGVNPVDWIRAMHRYHAKLDAYAHHPYPTSPKTETPWSGGCSWCKTITMADLDRLIREVRVNFPGKRIWLTEYGYQTNPPDRLLGVSPARQALYASAASLRARQAPYVDMLIHFMIRDDSDLGGWQSGLRTLSGVAKPAYDAFRLPLAEVSRSGSQTVMWGQVRPRSGRQPYRLQQLRSGVWRSVGSQQLTDGRGFFTRTVAAGRGTKLRLWSPRDSTYSPVFTVR
jgi:hypothetical protein